MVSAMSDLFYAMWPVVAVNRTLSLSWRQMTRCQSETAVYERYSLIFPAMCISDISHTFVVYLAAFDAGNHYFCFFRQKLTPAYMLSVTRALRMENVGFL